MSARTHRTMGAEEIRKATKRAKRSKSANGSKTGANGRGPSWANQCTRTRAGAIDGANVHNVLIALRHAPEWCDVIAFDAFARHVVIRREIPAGGKAATRNLPRMLEDSDVLAALEWFHAQGMVALRKGMLHDAMLLHARDHGRFHPVLDYFHEVLTAEEPREVPSIINGHRIDPDQSGNALSLLLTLGFGAADTPLNRAISRAFMISMVRRVRQPGCQHDHLLVLIGDQGIGKSGGLAMLVGAEWFTDHLPELHSKDALIQLRGKVLIEWAEMGALRRSQVERSKMFITSRIDTFRPPYERAAVNVPRACSFAGTSNIGDFLDDATGGRRFWPVECERTDLTWIEANRSLLWRLAAEAESAGEDGWITATDLQDELIKHQADAQRPDVWEDYVRDYASKRAVDGVHINADFLLGALSIPIKDQHNGHMQRVAAILKRAGWERARRSRADGQARRWLPKTSQ
jgi:predicted P-loop ATPase